MKTKDALLDIVPELEQIDEFIIKIIKQNPQKFALVNSTLIKMKGKKLRPALFLISARLHWNNLENLIPIAASLELIHTATLMHDDVLDNANLRRGVPTLNSIWGNHMSVLIGDYIFSKAFTILTANGSLEIIDLIANVVEKTSAGEIGQQLDSFNTEITEEEYLERIELKTAVFMASCCLAGCLTSDAAEELKKTFFQFGLNLGMAFQIIDDVLDFSIEKKSSIGKDICSDLKNGVITLPLIHTLQLSKRKNEIISWINDRKLGEDELLSTLQEIKLKGGLSYSLKLAEDYISKAFKCLERIPSKEVRDGLKVISRIILDRGL
ncbi:MAG: polyprenyl synthetase family protein [Bacillota bacterium]|nr:polyprenyl synthetase family protein [Bacillota bacterium]